MRNACFKPTSLILTAAFLAACAQDAATPSSAPQLHKVGTANRGASEAIQMCKIGKPGRYTFTIETSPANTGIYASPFYIDIAQGDTLGCAVGRPWTTALGQSYTIDVNITEQVPAGQQVKHWYSWTQLHDAVTGVHITPLPNPDTTFFAGTPTHTVHFDANQATQQLTVLWLRNEDIPARASLGDFVWHDLNANGVQDSNEPGIAGVGVSLNGGAQSATTDANGGYGFSALVAGAYTVNVTTPAGYVASPTGQGTAATDHNGSPTGATLAAGEHNPTLDFGFYQLASLGNFVWVDTDGDGVQDAAEPGIPGLTVTLNGPGGTQTTTTGANGGYGFSSLVPGDYTVSVGTPAGFAASPSNQGGDPAKDSNGSPTSTTLSSGESDQTLDFGFVPLRGSIGNFVWKDLDKDGVQDAGEPGIAGVTVTLDGVGGTWTQTTDTNGGYLFTNLLAGSYTVTVGTPSGLTASPSNQGGNPTKDSNGSPATVVLAAGENNLTIDFGFYLAETLGLQGCTPGYWKQSQHFGSYTSTGLKPTDSYNTVFGVTAWPASFTLVDALGQGGGGINRLARHSTAALLNALSTGVAYGMTSAQVIAATKQAIASKNYDLASDQFAPLNEKGCPLGRDEGESDASSSGKSNGKKK